MSLKNVNYQRLETEDSEDEAPPSHVQLNGSNHVKGGNRWNHIENLDEFFERVYEYQQHHGLAAIFLSDILELFQFLFMVVFTTFLVSCLQFHILWVDTIPFEKNNQTGQRDVIVSDLFDLSGLDRINPVVVLFLLMAIVFWIHRLFRTAVRFYRFWEIRRFYVDALGIRPSCLRDLTWPDVLSRLKEAQNQYKMNIRKHELTELDVYHRILRFKNYMVAMINKSILPCKFHFPLYGEKVFFTQGLKFNYELLLFWPSLRAPFKNSFYLHEEYKSAANKHLLIRNLKYRITILSLVNLVFCPVIFLYQILYSFFNYAELLKRQPGVFGRRRWSLYGRWHLRDFNELDHELVMRMNRAYKPSVKYMDLFANPIVVLIARNIAFVAGSTLAVLLVLTVIQEDLLTAHNVLTFMTLLGLIVTACRLFIPNENQVWRPESLMQRILGEIHYMPDSWKQRPHTLEVYNEFTHVFQFTVMNLFDELLSPLVTPFILYFSLRPKAGEIVDFLRSFTIDVSGVGDVCSFAEMNVRKHGQPEWLSGGVSRASQYEQAQLGKTEISLVQFSRKHPAWKPSEDGAAFMSKLKESIDELHKSQVTMATSPESLYPYVPHEEDLPYISLQPSMDYLPPPPVHPGFSSAPGVSGHPVAEFLHSSGQMVTSHHQLGSMDPMQWSIWSAQPSYPSHVVDHSAPTNPLVESTLLIHRLHDRQKAQNLYPGLYSESEQTLAGGTVLKVLHSSESGSDDQGMRVNMIAEQDGQRVEETAMGLVEPLLSQHTQPNGRGDTVDEWKRSNQIRDTQHSTNVN